MLNVGNKISLALDNIHLFDSNSQENIYEFKNNGIPERCTIKNETIAFCLFDEVDQRMLMYIDLIYLCHKANLNADYILQPFIEAFIKPESHNPITLHIDFIKYVLDNFNYYFVHEKLLEKMRISSFIVQSGVSWVNRDGLYRRRIGAMHIDYLIEDVEKIEGGRE